MSTNLPVSGGGIRALVRRVFEPWVRRRAHRRQARAAWLADRRRRLAMRCEVYARLDDETVHVAAFVYAAPIPDLYDGWGGELAIEDALTRGRVRLEAIAARGFWARDEFVPPARIARLWLRPLPPPAGAGLDGPTLGARISRTITGRRYLDSVAFPIASEALADGLAALEDPRR